MKQLEIDATQVELGGFPHYMLKEIFEQPETVQAAMRGRLNRDEATAVFGGLNLTPQQLRAIDRIVLTACGTSWHAALVGEYMIEEFARIPVEVEYASELRYRNPPMTPSTLLFAITQSGETIDTLAALREMKRKGHPTLAICNVVGSTIAREADGGVYLHAGPEIGVASTKAFTSQCVVMALLALYFGRLRHLSFEAGLRIIDELAALPRAGRARRSTRTTMRGGSRPSTHRCDNFLYLGRQYNFPTALEGRLKLKEISYIHAEGYPAAEMKHGPIALVDEHTPSVFIVPQGGVYHKVISNMEEIKARGGPVIAIVDKDDSHAVELADDVIRVPAVPEFLQPIVTVDPAATAGLPHRRPPRLRRRQAAESGEERDGGVNLSGRGSEGRESRASRRLMATRDAKSSIARARSTRPRPGARAAGDLRNAAGAAQAAAGAGHVVGPRARGPLAGRPSDHDAAAGSHAQPSRRRTSNRTSRRAMIRTMRC